MSLCSIRATIFLLLLDSGEQPTAATAAHERPDFRCLVGTARDDTAARPIHHLVLKRVAHGDRRIFGVAFAPGDPEDLARSLRSLAEMPSSALRQMGERGRAYYHEHLSLELGYRRMAQIFTSLRPVG